MQPHADTAEFSRALAIVAHPDDVEYGLAGTVARWTQEGKTVTYLLVTTARRGARTRRSRPPRRARCVSGSNGPPPRRLA